MGVVKTSGAFAGNERFEVLGLLGKGASGTVYEAFDRKRQIRVALKTLTQLDPEVRYRFKREFRALSNVRHQNVVELFELSTDVEPWFFTMELIKGTDVMTYLRGRSAPAGTGVTQRSRTPTERWASSPPSPPRDEAEVRRVFAELCRGLHALHELGLLHRDVKPSNVLVSHEGRVVLVDFGIVAELNKEAMGRSGDLEAMVGTPAYMAPEQGSGDTVTVASDWYAVGVMLFQALTGRLPFEEPGVEALMAKLERPAPAVHSVVPEVPSDLAALCDKLLAEDPRARPSFPEIMAGLGESERAKNGREEEHDSDVFVGRERELEELHAALSEVRTGRPVLVHVPGTSGMGKSELLARFLREVTENGTGLVLQGRCCERESVPFKALDDVIDALAVQLAMWPEEKFPPLPDGGAAALVRLFPVLGQVPALAPFDIAVRRVFDGQEASYSRQVRVLALGALRVILHRLSEQKPVVLAIDDAQWGDEDSAALLAELVAPPVPPGVLIVLAYRKEWAARAPLLNHALTAHGITMRSVPVEPLPEERARALALHWLGDAVEDAAVDAIVAEAGGSPFFIMEFARHVRLAGAKDTRLDLAEVLLRRFQELEEAPRRLLEALAVGARPLDPLLAARASGLDPEQGAAALRALRLAHLVRDNDRVGTSRVETFHDRVREALVSHLDPARLVAQHERFVTALTELAPDDVEALYQHCRGAGDRERAAHYAALSASEAVKSMAFVRAAELFAAALELAPQDDPRAQSWRIGRANTLAYAGRRKDAAEAYLAAAEATPSSMESVWLCCSAIEQYLAGGHPDLGMPIAARTLRKLGLPLAGSRNSALLSMAARMIWLRLRGSGFRERTEAEVPAEQLAQIDAAHRVARGVSITDPIRGGEMFLRTVSLALKAGEIKRISVAVSCMSTMIAIEGPSPYAQKLLDQGVELANRSQDAHTLAVATMNEGCVLALNGFWSEALEKLERTDMFFQMLRGLETADQQNARSVTLLVRYYLGRIGELIQLVPAAVADAVQRGDAYSRSLLTTSKASLCWLATDEPERHAELNETGLTTKARGNNLCIEHVSGLVNLIDNDLYVGEPERAMVRLAETLPAAKASLMLRMVITATQTNDAHGRAALMLAAMGKKPREHRRLALSLAKRIRKYPLPWPMATASMIEAGEADVDGRAEEAVERYRKAASEFDAAHMALHANVARLRLGQWLGGDEGAMLKREAERWMQSQGIVNTAKMARMLAPSRHDMT